MTETKIQRDPRDHRFRIMGQTKTLGWFSDLNLVLVDAEDADSVELGKLWDEHAEKRSRVYDEVHCVVLCVEAGQEIQNDGGNGEELSGGGELHSVVKLFPMSEESGLALVWSLKRRPFDCMHEHIHAEVVNDVGEGPHQRDTEEGDAEEDYVQSAHSQGIGQPDPTAVHDPCVGIHLAVCHTHVHCSC